MQKQQQQQEQGQQQPKAGTWTEVEVLELRTWIDAADKRGLIATIDDLAALPLNSPTLIVPLEYSKFLLHEWAERYPEPAQGVTCEPTVFFKPLCNTFTRLEDLSEASIPHHKGDRVSIDMLPRLAGRLVFADGEVCERAGFRSTRNNRQAESGSGDGYSRWILWSRLEAAGMPSVYNGPDYY
jgi:hypothetical protein